MIYVLSVLYLANAVITIAAYLPQVICLERTKSKPKNFSLASWILWTYTSIITLLYAFLIVKDPILIIVSALNLTCIAIIVAIIFYKNIKYKD